MLRRLAPPEIQPAGFAFNAENAEWAKKEIAKYPGGRQASAVIALLWRGQEQEGWVTHPMVESIARMLSMPFIRVLEVATFYTMFNLEPVGTYLVQVCTTTPCWLRGSDEVTDACRQATGIKGWGETSDDKMFTMTEVECLGACVNAPILQVDDDFYEDMDAGKVTTLLAALRRGERPTPGSMSGRQTSAPDGGPTTLTTLQFAPEA